MRWLLFLAKVAFICNLFFILCLLMRHTHLTVPEKLKEFVVITGWLMSVVFNVLFGLAVIRQRSRRLALDVPGYIVAFNFTIMFIQVTYYIFFR